MTAVKFDSFTGNFGVETSKKSVDEFNREIETIGRGRSRVANQFLESWGICRSTKSDALRVLEAKGLISVDRRPGKAVRVTVLVR